MCVTSERRERADLSRLENLLLWSMRAWVIGLHRRLPVEEQIDEAFAAVGAAGAAGLLCGFMWILGHGAGRVVEIDCVCHPGISDDERLLLDILALAQHDRSEEAVILLCSMVTARAALEAADSAGRVMACLGAAGQFLSCRPVLEAVSGRFAKLVALRSRRPVTIH